METVTRTGPLSGYRVLDLAGPLGLHCTKLLADMGADVIKIDFDEPYHGDFLVEGDTSEQFEDLPPLANAS